MPKADLYDCVVVGAGITGLSSAYFLSKKSDKIALVDGAAERGLIKTVCKEGFTLECGPNVVALKPDFMQLVQDLGLESQITYPRIENYKQMVFVNNKACVVPKGPAAFLKSDLFCWTDKLKILKNLFINHSFRYNSQDISVSDFFTPIIGKQAVLDVLDPVLLGIYGGDVNKLSATSIFPGFSKKIKDGKNILSIMKAGGVKPKIAVIKGGMQSISDKLKKEVTSNTKDFNSNLADLNYLQGVFTLTLENGEKLNARSVIVATSGKATSSFIGKLDSELSQNLNQFKSASLTVVHASVKSLPEEFNDSFGVLLPGKLHTPFLGVMFDSRLFPHLAPAGQELMTICLGGMHHSDFINREDSEVTEFTLQTLYKKFGIESARVINICRWKNAIPQYNLGHNEIVARFRQTEIKYPGLFFAGADNGGVGVPDRVSLAKHNVNLTKIGNL